MKIEGYSYANRGNNSYCASIGDIDFYFSYETLVAVWDNIELAIIKNYWGTTTGGHLNSIHDDHSIRLEQEEFDKKVDEMMERNGLLKRSD